MVIFDHHMRNGRHIFSGNNNVPFSDWSAILNWCYTEFGPENEDIWEEVFLYDKGQDTIYWIEISDDTDAMKFKLTWC